MSFNEWASPIPDFDAPELAKVTHVLGVGDKVTVKPTGHRGKITNILHGKYYVTLPTGHALCCDLDELVPVDLPLGTNAGKLEGFGGLIKSIKNETISAHDLVMAQRALERIDEDAVSDPFGGFFNDGPSEPMQILKALAERYQDTADAGDLLAKRASGFSVGDRVRERHGERRVGKITALKTGAVCVRWDNGIEGIVVNNYVEAAA